MLSLQFHLKKSRGTLIIYHPRNDNLKQSYPEDILEQKLKNIENEMIKMKGGLRVSVKDHIRIRWRRKVVYID
jgi:hypothetical protein